MSTPQTSDGRLTDAPNFCEHCGTVLGAGRYCPGCGHPVSLDAAEVQTGPDENAAIADANEMPEHAPRDWTEPPTDHDGPTAMHHPAPAVPGEAAPLPKR